jgi:hypothetical protein
MNVQPIISTPLSLPSIPFVHPKLQSQIMNRVCRVVAIVINTTITVLDIIHRLVFCLKLNSIDCPYITGNILRLRYEPNRLILSKGFWRWYINITTTILDIIYRPVFYLKLNSTL